VAWMSLSEGERAGRTLDLVLGEDLTKVKTGNIGAIQGETTATWGLVGAQMAAQAAMFGMIYATQKWGEDSWQATAVIGALAGVVMGLAVAKQLAFDAGSGKMWATVAIGAVTMAAFNVMMRDMMKMPKQEELKFKPLKLGGDTTGGGGELYDMGGTIPSRRIYDNGGIAGRHFPAMVEPGETIIPKTQNMLGGGGLTINMGDVQVQDGEDFAERVAEALPLALRRVDESGGFA